MFARLFIKWFPLFRYLVFVFFLKSLRKVLFVLIDERFCPWLHRQVFFRRLPRAIFFTVTCAVMMVVRLPWRSSIISSNRALLPASKGWTLKSSNINASCFLFLITSLNECRRLLPFLGATLILQYWYTRLYSRANKPAALVLKPKNFCLYLCCP